LEYIESRGGSWTVHQGRAHAFASVLEAVLFCLNQQLSNMQILVAYTDAMMNFNVPVAETRATMMSGGGERGSELDSKGA